MLVGTLPKYNESKKLLYEKILKHDMDEQKMFEKFPVLPADSAERKFAVKI